MARVALTADLLYLRRRIMLRDYQQRAINELYAWFGANPTGNPCLVLPTGSGKSWIVAALCKDALTNWPSTRILMLTHVKELIEQNAEKMRMVWPGAPMGIYSASVGRRQLGEPITFAGIQSVRNRADQLGHVDLVIVDECHLISHKAEGGYRQLIGALTAINPALRVVGLTATPWRLGHGMITEGPALFDDLIEPVTIEELVYKGFLAPLKSKLTDYKLQTDGVHKRGGEYIESELQAAVDTDSHNAAVVDEVIRLAGDRKAWLFFCAGVEHSEHVREVLRMRGIAAECVTGKTPKRERERIIADFRAGRLRALTNANVLTTGFDHPDIDLIAMLRPTLSPVLYVQMAGRGLRPKSHTDHCIVLDFAGVVKAHGPITAVEPPGQAGTGDAPVKSCPECHELVHASAKDCPDCGHQFEMKPEGLELRLRDDDIMGTRPLEIVVTDWQWRVHTSQTSGKSMLLVTYYGGLSDEPVREYICIAHDGFAGAKAAQRLAYIADYSGASAALRSPDMDAAAEIMNSSTPPTMIKYHKKGRAIFDIIHTEWSHPHASSRA